MNVLDKISKPIVLLLDGLPVAIHYPSESFISLKFTLRTLLKAPFFRTTLGWLNNYVCAVKDYF